MMRKILTTCFVLVAAVFFSCRSVAGDEFIDAQVKAVANQVLKSIFNDIYFSKKGYEDLSGFNDSHLAINSYGLSIIQYTAISGGLVFGLTIIPMVEKSPFEGFSGAFEYGFPLLKLKFAGFQDKGTKRQQFDINKSIQRHGKELWLEQQRFLPLKLSLDPLKSVYKKGEAVTFRVTLKNNTGKSIVVKDLNSKTLFFVYSDSVWGTSESSAVAQKKIKNIVLKPGESLQKNFSGNAFSKPQEFEIFCTYNLTYDGVNPSANLKIKVVE